MKLVYAPVSGKIITLEKTADPVFSEKMLGNGYAIEPDLQANMIYSPINGQITVINGQKHALALTSKDDLDVLIHVGVDTINLDGKGFKMLCKVGQYVTIGSPLIEVDFEYLKNYATDTTVFVIITNTHHSMIFTPTTSSRVQPEDLFYTIR